VPMRRGRRSTLHWPRADHRAARPGIVAAMGLEEHTVEDTFERRCQECGAPLTDAEILAAREKGGPFLCSVHSAESLPAEEEEEIES